MAVPVMFLPLIVYWVPIAAAVVGVLKGAPAMFAAGISAYVTQAALLLLVVPMCRMRCGKALCFPLIAVPVFSCFVNALYYRCVRGGVSWRGRMVQVVDKS